VIDVGKIAYLYTFHSQVAETLCNIEFWPDIILSFDAHAHALHITGTKGTLMVDLTEGELRDMLCARGGSAGFVSERLRSVC
jgi:hypothetical protein